MKLELEQNRAGEH